MKRLFILIFLSLVVILLGFVSKDNSMQKEFKKCISLGKANDVKTEIVFPVGTSNLSSSSKHIAKGTYKFYKDKWKPNISYKENNQVGNLQIVASAQSEKNKYDDLDNSHWDVAISKDVRNDLSILFNAGESNIDLHDCNLKRFEFIMTAGDVNINLSNTSVPNMLFKAFAGNAVIDLSGDWKNDLNAILKGGLGEMTVKVPSNIGVKFNILGILGDVNAPNFKKQNTTYTNDLFGKTKQSLYFDITGGIGNVDIQIVD